MTWGVLGEIEFEVLSHPSAQSERTTADYAEHARLQGKPLLQWVGDGLDELTRRKQQRERTPLTNTETTMQQEKHP